LFSVFQLGQQLTRFFQRPDHAGGLKLRGGLLKVITGRGDVIARAAD